MSAGIVIYQYREKIIELPRLYILFLTLLTAALYVNHFVNEFVMGAFYEGHLLALILFIFAIRHPDVKFYGSDWLAKIGLKYSAYIYIFHVLVNAVISKVIEYDSIFSQIMRPWSVFIMSLLLSMIFVEMKNRLAIKSVWSILK